jgi:branched-chain amino acid transport system substrate-binding protein
VFALFQTLGTASNTAIIKYTNSKQVPNIFIGSVAEKHGDAEAYPWTLPWNPTGVLEGTQQAQWLIKERPNAKIALLYQNDDYGKDFARGIKTGLGKQAAKAVIAEATYEVTDPTVDSQVITLQGSGADVLVMAGTPKFGAQAIRKVYDMNWRPLFIVSNPLSLIESTLKPAGLEKAIGLISASYFKADPEQWSNDPAMQDYLSMMRKYYPDANANDGTNIYGYMTAMVFHEVLKRCGDNLTRENLMRQATSLKNVAQPMLLDGVTLNTSPTNHHPIGKMYPVRFDGKRWQLLKDAEIGALPMDETLRARAQKLQARRGEVLLEMAKLKDRRQFDAQKINPASIDAFCKALKARLIDVQSGLGKAYLRLLVDEIQLEGNELKLRGSYRRMANAIGLVDKMKLGEVPSFIPDWRARQDSNPRTSR